MRHAFLRLNFCHASGEAILGTLKYFLKGFVPNTKVFWVSLSTGGCTQHEIVGNTPPPATRRIIVVIVIFFSN